MKHPVWCCFLNSSNSKLPLFTSKMHDFRVILQFWKNQECSPCHICKYWWKIASCYFRSCVNKTNCSYILYNTNLNACDQCERGFAENPQASAFFSFLLRGISRGRPFQERKTRRTGSCVYQGDMSSCVSETARGATRSTSTRWSILSWKCAVTCVAVSARSCLKMC